MRSPSFVLRKALEKSTCVTVAMLAVVAVLLARVILLKLPHLNLPFLVPLLRLIDLLSLFPPL
jgi:hypothetical protein